MRPLQLEGNRVGRLLVIKYIGNRGIKRMWLCQCDYRNEVTVWAARLSGVRPTQSCGCLRKEAASKTGKSRLGA